MTPEEQAETFALGKEVIRMFRDLARTSDNSGGPGYGRRKFIFPGGSFVMLLLNDERVADIMEAAAGEHYKLVDITPPSQTH